MRAPVVVLVAVAMLAGGCGGRPSEARPQATPLRLGVATTSVPPLPNSVLWLAGDDGFYRREGLDVSLLQVDGTPRVIAAMLSGDIDVGNVATDQVLQLAASGRADLRALHSPDPRQFFLIASAGRIGRVEELRGRTLAISAIGGVDDTTTQLVLRARGVAPTDLNVVALGDPTARAAALVAGRVDATTISIGTWSTMSDHTGIRVLVSPAEYYDAAPLVAKVDAVTAGILATKREALQRFTRAVLKALRHYALDRQAWIDAMVRRRPELDRQALAALWEQFRGSWAIDGGVDPARLGATAGILFGSPELAGVPRVSIDRWADLSVLDAALRQLGKE